MQLPETNNTLIDPITLFSKTWTQYQALFAPLFATAFLGIFAASLISGTNSDNQAGFFFGQLIFLASIIPSTISEAAVIMLVSMKRDLESTSIARAYSLVFPLIHRLLIPSILLAIFINLFYVISVQNISLMAILMPLILFIVARTSLYVPVILLEQSSSPWSVSFILSPIIRSNALVKGKTLRTLGLLAPALLGAGILTVLVPAVMGVGGPDGSKVALILTGSIVSALIQPYIIILTLFIYENYAQVEAQKEIDELSINPNV